MTAPATFAGQSGSDHAFRVTVVALALVTSAVLGSALVGKAAMSSNAFVLLLPAIPLYLIAMWKRPRLTILISLASALLFEQFTYQIMGHPGPFTANVPVFRSFGNGVILLPIEVIILIGLLVWLMQAALAGRLELPRSAFAKSLAAFLALCSFGFVLGLSRGGDYNIALWEVRPFFLLAVAYFLTSIVIKDRGSLRVILWLFVICTGFKSLQATYMFFSFARAMNPRPESLLSHEESVFFGILMVLTIGLWVYGQRGALRRLSTALLPFVVIATMANSRRTAWPIVILGLLMLLVIAWVTHPEKRRVVGPILVMMAMVSAVYFPLYWNKTGGGTLSQPARAVRSTVSPDPRDELSNQYREQENANLELNIRESAPLGKGFGLPINYALPIVDVSNFDPMIKFIPHNGGLWIWMRLGLQGEMVFWIMLGSAFIAASRLARSRDTLLALFGALTVSALIGYILQGWQDLGFDNLRVSVVIGCLLGCVEAASRFRHADESADERTEELVST
jgi:hypothetical protein